METVNKNNINLFTIYSEGAINSTVAFLTSGLLAGSPYCLVVGSKQNSSGTKTKSKNLSVKPPC